METKTPAEAFVGWIRLAGPTQTFLRWLALIPGVAIIFLLFQLTLLFGLSFIARSDNQTIVSWLSNMLNAAFVPFLIIKYGTPIAPSLRRHTSVALALVAVCLVVLQRLAFELGHPGQSSWRYAWLAIAAVVCGASVWFGLSDRGINGAARPRQ